MGDSFPGIFNFSASGPSTGAPVVMHILKLLYADFIHKLLINLVRLVLNYILHDLQMAHLFSPSCSSSLLADLIARENCFAQCGTVLGYIRSLDFSFSICFAKTVIQIWKLQYVAQQLYNISVLSCAVAIDETYHPRTITTCRTISSNEYSRTTQYSFFC